MKRRLKNIGVGISAFFCVAAMVAWGFGTAGWGFDCAFPLIRGYGFTFDGMRGGLWFFFGNFEEGQKAGLAWVWPYEKLEIKRQKLPVWPYDLSDAIFIRPTTTIGRPDEHAKYMHDLVLPYWLLILLFALAPALWWRNRYVARRDKKLFEQAVASKRAEMEGKPSNQNPEH